MSQLFFTTQWCIKTIREAISDINIQHCTFVALRTTIFYYLCINQLTLMRILQQKNFKEKMRIRDLFLLIAVAIMGVACESAEVNDNDKCEITILTESPLWLDSEQCMGEIEYSTTGGSSTTKLEAWSSVEWASVVEIQESVISFVALKNDEASDRRGTITLKYGDAKAEIKIYQHVKVDENYTATTTDGSLFTHLDNEAGVHSYKLVLSREGLKEDGSFYASAKYYCFDLCATEVVSKEASKAIIPNGTYRLTTGGELCDRGINYMYSYYSYMAQEVPMADAEVIVEDGKIVANVALANGENHRVEYSGSLEIPVHNATVTEGLSTLTGPHTFKIEGGVFVGAFVGDLMYNGCNTCQLFMYEYLDYETGEERGDQFQIDLQLAAGSRDVCGTYTHGTTAGHFIPGSAEDLGGQYMQQNSWYMTAGYVDFAPLSRGSIKVENVGGSTYLFTIDTVDDRGNAIKGTFQGDGEFIDW